MLELLSYLPGLALVVAYLAVLGLICFTMAVIHEGGHWLAAKKFGLPAPIFSLSPGGAPYRVIGQAFDTEFRWSWRWIESCYVAVVFDPADAKKIDAVESETGMKVPKSRAALWWQCVIVYAAGPFANLLCAGACFILAYALMPPWYEMSLNLGVFLQILLLISVINAISGLANLLPFRPLDGGRILESCRRRRLSYVRP